MERARLVRIIGVLHQNARDGHPENGSKIFEIVRMLFQPVVGKDRAACSWGDGLVKKGIESGAEAPSGQRSPLSIHEEGVDFRSLS